MSHKSRIAVTIASVLLAPSLWAKSFDNNALSYYCGNDDVEFEQNVTVGRGTKVILNEGAFYQIEQESDYEPTLSFINKQITNVGVNEECAEFLLTQGLLHTMNNSDVLARLYFDFDRSSLTDKSKYILDSLVEVIQHSSRTLTLEGHTDSRGAESYNFSLGLKRSKAVEQYLIEHGVDPKTMKVTSKGEAQPISSNDTAGGRHENRRVDVK
ncbi:OmpA family protein [Vibrio sp. Of7-15]|uniref:OmpA family protein n=1 Tax=Vibrio sp. Of7-15 TaxID=2724879 RepID=UPI001EF320CE|nr:OmpA family protein [Vibrio sp. Of7-15]MCG7497045.1 OmpA family protein [Vibrio sp. Of7-15]